MSRRRLDEIEREYNELSQLLYSLRRQISPIALSDEAQKALSDLTKVANEVPELVHALKIAADGLEEIANEHDRIKSGAMTRMFPPVHARETLEQIGYEAE